ncbi:MAG: isocitrate/isopropylmalate family dehydrogenase [Pirellula sp.]
MGLHDEAQQIETAVRNVLAHGHRTADLVPRGQASIGTEAMTQKVLENL